MKRHNYYETINIPDPTYPVTFHDDSMPSRCNSPKMRVAHWHENIEILYFKKGRAQLFLNSEEIYAGSDDIVIVNSNHLHSINGFAETAEYYCLIIDKSLYKSMGMKVDDYYFQNKLQSEYIANKIMSIVKERDSKLPMYRAKIIAQVIDIMVELCRSFAISSKGKNEETSVEEIVKKAMSYISRNLNEKVNLEDIIAEVGYSKYYFCRCFKKVTGMTLTEYINLLRCQNARTLMRMKGCTVAESAFQSGFQNLSYFTKKYKEIMGVLPSKDTKIYKPY